MARAKHREVNRLVSAQDYNKAIPQLLGFLDEIGPLLEKGETKTEEAELLGARFDTSRLL
jgi:hypothetical protein